MAKPYIGGTPNQARLKYIEKDNDLRKYIKSLSSQYNVPQEVILNRLMKEGIIDEAIKQYNATGELNSIVNWKEIDAFRSLGLDDIGDELSSGRVKPNRNIEYETISAENEKGRSVNSAFFNNAKDALEVFVAGLNYRQREAKKYKPDATKEELDSLTGAFYNWGITGAKRGIENGNLNIDNYRPSNQLKDIIRHNDPDVLIYNNTNQQSVPEYRNYNPNFTTEQYKYGGKMNVNQSYKLYGYRPRQMAVGGDVSYEAPSVERDVAGNIGNATTSTVSGALSGLAGGIGLGLATGAGFGSVLGPIGAGVGALFGLVGGLFGNRRRRRERRRQADALRNQTVANMEARQEQEYVDLQSQNLTGITEASDYYAKYGGRIKTRMAQGGLVPNSSSTQVAYGATHNQVNNNTGETGVAYGNVEVEGGGDYGNRMEAGEVIYNNGTDESVYSDRLRFLNTDESYAAVARKISNKLGKSEKKAQRLSRDLDRTLDSINNARGNKASMSTQERNAEKIAYRLNKASGEVYQAHEAMNELFNIQEQQATQAGLRENTDVMAYGGRRKMALGGLGVLVGGNFLLNGLSAASNALAIREESRMTVPQRTRVNAPRYGTNYNINTQLSEVDRSLRNTNQFIQSNVNNPQIARAAYANTAVNALGVRNQLYQQQNLAQQEMYNRNVDAQYQTNAINSEAMYQNTVDRYNRNVNINSSRAANRRQLLQGISNTLGDVTNVAMQQYMIDSSNSLQVSNADVQRQTNNLRSFDILNFMGFRRGQNR